MVGRLRKSQMLTRYCASLCGLIRYDRDTDRCYITPPMGDVMAYVARTSATRIACSVSDALFERRPSARPWTWATSIALADTARPSTVSADQVQRPETYERARSEHNWEEDYRGARLSRADSAPATIGSDADLSAFHATISITLVPQSEPSTMRAPLTSAAAPTSTPPASAATPTSTPPASAATPTSTPPASAATATSTPPASAATPTGTPSVSAVAQTLDIGGKTLLAIDTTLPTKAETPHEAAHRLNATLAAWTAQLYSIDVATRCHTRAMTSSSQSTLTAEQIARRATFGNIDEQIVHGTTSRFGASEAPRYVAFALLATQDSVWTPQRQHQSNVAASAACPRCAHGTCDLEHIVQIDVQPCVAQQQQANNNAIIVPVGDQHYRATPHCSPSNTRDYKKHKLIHKLLKRVEDVMRQISTGPRRLKLNKTQRDALQDAMISFVCKSAHTVWPMAELINLSNSIEEIKWIVNKREPDAHFPNLDQKQRMRLDAEAHKLAQHMRNVAQAKRAYMQRAWLHFNNMND